MYFQEQLKLNSESLKTTWKLIGMVVNSKRICGQPPITKLIFKWYTQVRDKARERW